MVYAGNTLRGPPDATREVCCYERRSYRRLSKKGEQHHNSDHESTDEGRIVLTKGRGNFCTDEEKRKILKDDENRLMTKEKKSKKERD